MKHLFSNKNDHDFQNGFKKLERFKIQIGEGNIIMYIAVVHLSYASIIPTELLVKKN